MKYDKLILLEDWLAFHINFLQAATDNDNTRCFMDYIHIEKSDKGEDKLLGVATNGRCIYLVDPLHDSLIDKGLTIGDWKVFKISSRTVSERKLLLARAEDENKKNQYPNWRKCIPNSEAAYSTTFNGFDFKQKHPRYIELVKLFRDFPDATAINLSYIKGLGTNDEWKVEWNGATKVIKFTCREKAAFVMPMTM